MFDLKKCLKITWGRRIEFNTHRCQTFLRKMSVQRVHYCLIAKGVRFYTSNRYSQNIVKCGQNTILLIEV